MASGTNTWVCDEDNNFNTGGAFKASGSWIGRPVLQSGGSDETTEANDYIVPYVIYYLKEPDGADLSSTFCESSDGETNCE